MNTNIISNTISLPFIFPYSMVIDPETQLIYVGHLWYKKISIIDANTETYLGDITVGSDPVYGDPRGLEIDKDRRLLYVSNTSSGDVQVVDLNGHNVIHTIKLPYIGTLPDGRALPSYSALHPSRNKLYVTNDSVRDPAVYVINTLTYELSSVITGIGSEPLGIAIDPQKDRVYVANSQGGSVSVIDSVTDSVITDIPVGAAPMGIDIDTSSGRLYVACKFVDALYVIDTANNTVINIIDVGDGPSALGKFIMKTARKVDIDIKPGNYPNYFNQNERGVIPVAIMGSADLDIGLIDVTSLSLQGLKVKVAGKSNYLSHIEYVNDDEYPDLLVQFVDSDDWIVNGSDIATMKGKLKDGTSIEGSDAICIVP